MVAFRFGTDAGRIEYNAVPDFLRSMGAFESCKKCPAANSCIGAAGAGLAGVSRGFSRPAPIAIGSSETAHLGLSKSWKLAKNRCSF